MIDTMKPYPEYKDSGLPWLGSIPQHWDCLPHRAIFEEIKEQGHVNEPLLSVTIGRGIIRQEDLLANSSKKDSSNLDKSKYKLVEPGDIAYNKMRAWQGAVGASRYRGIVSPAYIVQRLRDELRPEYFHYLFRTPGFAKEAERWSYGITSDQWSLRPQHFKMIYSCVPPLDEQELIVGVLHDLDRHVRRFIRNRRRLIDVLNEQKQAIINRAVTRGLDLDAPVKPSGIDWLGDIPEHWALTQLYRITDPSRPIMYGIVLPGPDVEDGVYIVKGGNCEDGKLTKPYLSKTTREIERRYVRSRLRENDIVYSIRGSIGSAQLVPAELEGANLTQDAARIACGPRIEPRWLLWAVRSRGFFAKLEAGARGAAVKGINIRDLKRADIVVPPQGEQLRIAEELERETQAIDVTLATTKREIDLIREYRTRLISDVVTGKVDVRHLAPPPGGEDPEEMVEALEPLDDEPGETDEESMDGEVEP